MLERAADASATLAPVAHAMTDVTGYGLAGHLMGMLEASGVGAQINLGAVPVLQGAEELLAKGIRSSLFDANAQVLTGHDLSDPRVALLADPQTAGGLLAAVPEGRVPAGEGFHVIGEITEETGQIRLK